MTDHRGVGRAEARGGYAPAVRARGRLTPMLRTSFVLRGLALWVALHLGMAFLEVVVFAPIQVLGMLVVVGAGVAADQRVRREHLLLGNAGVAPWVGPVHAVVTAALLELSVQVLARGMT